MTEWPTREAWLEAAIDMMRPMFEAIGAPLPKQIHVSVGFAYGARKENGKILGQTWARAASEDGRQQIFVSPEMGETYDVMETLIHELVHVADDNQSGHKGNFGVIALKLGLLRPFTYTPASPSLGAELQVMAIELGKYPHAAIHPDGVPALAPVFAGPGSELPDPVKLHSGPVKQTTRLLKAVCGHCGYTVRVTRTWLDEGLPRCPRGYDMKVQSSG